MLEAKDLKRISQSIRSKVVTCRAGKYPLCTKLLVITQSVVGVKNLVKEAREVNLKEIEEHYPRGSEHLMVAEEHLEKCLKSLHALQAEYAGEALEEENVRADDR